MELIEQIMSLKHVSVKVKRFFQRLDEERYQEEEEGEEPWDDYQERKKKIFKAFIYFVPWFIRNYEEEFMGEDIMEDFLTYLEYNNNEWDMTTDSVESLRVYYEEFCRSWDM